MAVKIKSIIEHISPVDWKINHIQDKNVYEILDANNKRVAIVPKLNDALVIAAAPTILDKFEYMLGYQRGAYHCVSSTYQLLVDSIITQEEVSNSNGESKS